MLKKLRQFSSWLRREGAGVWHLVALNALAGVMATAMSLLFVWCTKHIVDIATGRSLAGWGGAIALLVGALAGQLLFGAVSKRVGTVCQTRFSNSFRSRLFSHLMHAEWTGRERFHSSDAVGRLASDVATVSSTLSSTIPGLFVALVQLVAAFVFLLMLDTRMAWVLVAIMPGAMLLSKLYMRRSHRLTRSIREAESRIQCTMQESLQHRVLISTLLHTDATVRGFDETQNRFFSLVLKRNDISIFAGSAVTAGFMAGYTLAFLWCAFGLQSGAVTFGMMTAFLQLVGQVQRPVVDVAGRVPVFIQTSVAIERINEILAIPCEKTDQIIEIAAPVGLRLTNVSFAYPDSETVIRNLSHDFAPNSLTAVAGPTGTGKTTLLMLMLGLLRPSQGNITFYNRNTEVEASPATRANIVYVPQGNSLLSGTVRSNLLLARPEATDEEMTRALLDAEARFVLDLPLGLDTPCGERGHGLSEGQAQRIAIARGLLGHGSVLVLDEPSSALDAATESRLIENLGRIALSRTVIIVSHSPRLLASCKDIIHLQ